MGENMKSALAKAFMVALLFSGLPALAHGQTTLNFDSFPSFTTIPNGYGGLNWGNFGVLNAAFDPNSGYVNGLISSPNVAFNLSGTPASFSSVADQFTFTSAYLTAAWNDGLNLEIQAFDDGVMLDDVNLTLNTSGPVFYNPNWSGIDTITFISTGGVHHGGYVGFGTQVAMDDLTINGPSPTPEPPSFFLMGTGLAGLIGFVRRRLS
jgi:PEP-CTERM motif